MAIRRPLVLVAEESTSGRWALIHALQAEGFRLYATSTWLETVGWLERTPFDAAVISSSIERDQLPAVLAYLQRHAPAVRVMLLADSDELHSTRQCCGADAIVLDKRQDPAHIVEAIAALVAAPVSWQLRA